MALDAAKPDDIERWNPTIGDVCCNPANAARYDRSYNVFRGLYPATRGFLDQAEIADQTASPSS